LDRRNDPGRLFPNLFATISRKTVPVENPIENALIAQDEIGGYDWSYQTEEEHPTNYELMALTSLESSSSLDYENLDKAEKEKDELKRTSKKYQNSSKSLNTLLESQNKENVKSRSDKEYHAVPSPYTRNYIPPKPDLMFIDEQVKSESVDVVSNILSSVVKTVESKVKFVDVKNKCVYSTVETKPVRKNNFSPLIIEDWNSDVVKTDREKVNNVETPKQHKHYPRGNQRN
nr:hypothetical protein [Tanacetum cinerariifolium]